MDTGYNSYQDDLIAPRSVVAIRTLPVVGAAAAAAVFAWRTGGSIAAPDWLPLAVLLALLLATIAAAGAAQRPGRPLVFGAVALTGLAAWTAISIAWAPSPAGARDEALLVLLYAVTLVIGGLSGTGERQRLAAMACVVAVLGALGVASAADLLAARDPLGQYFGGRLDFPVSYVNACSALFVLGLWPAIALAARKGAPLAGRAAATAAGSLFLALAIAAQSKGTILGLAVSTVLVLAGAPSRLRLLLVLVLAAAPAVAAAAPLTDPYRSASTAAAHGVGAYALGVAALGGLLGLIYAAADARLTVGDRARRTIGRSLLVLLAAAIAAGAVAFATTTPSPGAWLSGKWAAFKHPDVAGGTTHLTSLGSNRYDFWRVALDTAARHPVAGVGGRGFYSSYLEHRRSGETPLRAHSLYLDTLAEEGVVGLALLVLAIGAPLLLAARRLRHPSAVGAFGATTYFFSHAAVDWIWTVPVVGIPALLLLGIGASGDDPRPARRSAALGGSALAACVAVFAFAPPWIAYRYVTSAYRGGDVSSDLSRARALDPLSLDPDWAEWRLAHTPAARVAALERARAQEPDSVAVLFQLGLAYEAARRNADARAALRRAHLLDPRDRAIRTAVARIDH